MTFTRTTLPIVVTTLLLAGCGGELPSLPSPPSLPGFGGSKPAPPPVDPNLYPSNYRQQIAQFLTELSKNRADFFGTLISPPALKPVAESTNLHYVVCLQFTRARGSPKAVLFLGGALTQFIEATPQQCGDAAYQPYPELERAAPSTK